MSDQIRQSLSHLMDNEADELELRRVLKACDEQDELADCWHRYHLMRSVMHKELEQPELFDLSDRIAEAIDNEPVPGMDQTPDESNVLPMSRWKQAGSWLGKGAIAASVAAAVVVLMPGNETSPPVIAEQVVAPQVLQQTLPVRGLQQSPIGIQRVSAGGSDNNYIMADNQKLKQEELIRGYLMQHSEYVAANGTHGMMPMARVAGYQTAGDAR